MKKILLLLPGAIGMILMLMTMIFYALDGGDLSDRNLLSGFLTGIFQIIGFVCNVIYFKKARRECCEVIWAARANVWLKLLHLPIGLVQWLVCFVMFIFLLAMTISAICQMSSLAEIGGSLVIICVCMFFICMFAGCSLIETTQSGVVAMVAVFRAREEGLLEDRRANAYQIGSCIPILDLVIAVRLWKLVKNESRYQEGVDVFK